LNRHSLGDLGVARFHMEGDAERRGTERNAELDIRVEDLIAGFSGCFQ
jgi:hypothetical protein